MSLNAYASAQADTCCLEADCPVMQCLDMGCLPAAASPVLPAAVPAWPRLEAARHLPAENVITLPVQYQKIWTPPD